MLQIFRELYDRQHGRHRSNRLIGAGLALLAEAILVLLVLSMALVEQKPPKRAVSLVSVNITQPESKRPESKQPETDKPRPARTLQPQRQIDPIIAAPAPPMPSPVIILPSKSAIPIPQLPPSPIRQQAAPSPGRGMMGPPDNGVPGDSKRVGTAPGGEPMYAASWYREPYDDELSGYLSTARGPGWALIACRTVADFRVEDCIGLDEYPSGSQIQRSVLAAAWQFRVRPPRRGGISRVGDWVRIRIDYSERRR